MQTRARLLAAAMIAAALFSGCVAGPDARHDDGSDSGEACASAELTHAPIDPATVQDVTPLGNLNPPEHTLPTEHVYLNVKQDIATSGGTPLVAPSDGRVISVSSNEDHRRGISDHGLTIEVCRGVSYYFLHVKSLEPNLLTELDDARCSEDDAYTHCWTDADLPITAGDRIGIVTSPDHWNFDFGFVDENVEHKFVDPKRYTSRTENIVCPFDRMVPGLRETWLDLLAGTEVHYCGSVAFDVPGTLAGNWFLSGADVDAVRGWDAHLAFVPDNHDPSISAVSVGGIFTDPAVWRFTTTADGRTNPAFEQVDETVGPVCYEDPERTHALWVQMIDPRHLEILSHDDCTDEPRFDGATVYAR